VKAGSSTQLERDIFLAMLEVSNPLERVERLKSACGGDATLRRRVEELLTEEQRMGAFLETPAIRHPTGSGGVVGQAVAPEPLPGRIGRYRILDRIGEGGCGVVYKAEQEEPVRRRVAVKVIKAGMDTRSVIARFEAERQALALMDHPNIATVLDAGSTEVGRPYFVMELVRGIRITEFCDQHNLTTRERLELFINVCHAIQHAHQKGIIHRDIKPSNILVTLHDGVPVPKVIDFGVAKAIAQRLTDNTVFTAFEQFIGTPAYMSPEQAEMSGLDIDTRSDIYSLGVLLYELLTGKTPFDGTELVQSGLDAMRRTIRETEPLRPSTRLQSLDLAEATEVVAQRQETLPALLKLVRGDLDWVVMKAVAKDRKQRYDSATALALDVQRYLCGHTVIARPPSRRYQFQKFVYRNKLPLAAAASIALVFVIAAVVSTWQAYRATQAQHEQSYLRRLAEVARLNEVRQRKRAENEQLAALRRAYDSDMNLIPQALQANNYGRVIELLNRQRHLQTSTAKQVQSPDFRQWEWRYYWNQARSDAAFSFPKQSDLIGHLALSADGRWLVTADRRGTVKLWDFPRRVEVATLCRGGSERRGTPFAVSTNGQRVAVALNERSRQAVIQVFATETARAFREMHVDGPVRALAFASDSESLLFWGGGQRLRHWDLTKNEPDQDPDEIQGSQGFQGRPGPGFPRPTLSPDTTLVALSEPGHLRVIHVQTGRQSCSVDRVDHPVAGLAFSPDNQLLAVSSLFTDVDTAIVLYSTANGQELGRLLGHASWVPDLVFTPDGTRLVSAGADQTIRVWDVTRYAELGVFRGQVSEINCLALSSDGKTIVSGAKDGSIFGWNAGRGQSKRDFETLPTPVNSIEFLPDSQSLLSVNRDGTVTVWDTVTLQKRESLAALGRGVERLVISPQGDRVYAGYRDGRITVMDWPGGDDVGPLPRASSSGPMTPLAVLNRGRTLLTAGPGSALRLWDTGSWVSHELTSSRPGSPFGARVFALSADERLAAVGAPEGEVELINLLSGRTERTLRLDNWGSTGIAFAPRQPLLAVGSGEGTITLWDLSSDSLADVLRGHLLGVHDVAFSPDGERLASASAKQDEAIKLWDVVARHEVATLTGEGTVFRHVRFSPDGTVLMAINSQGKAHFWRAPSLKEIAAQESDALSDRGFTTTLTW
jgi:WD40 repeat protein/serine/threonine protein kinase